MLAVAIIERSSALLSSVLSLFVDVKGFGPVTENAARTKEPVAWVYMDNAKGREPLLGAVFVAPDTVEERLIYLPIGGNGPEYERARYLLNPHADLNPTPAVHNNSQPFSKVGDFGTYVSEKTQAWLRENIEEQNRETVPVRATAPLAWVFQDAAAGRWTIVGMICQTPAARLAYVPLNDNGADYAHAQFIGALNPELKKQDATAKRQIFKDQLGDLGDYLPAQLQTWLRRNIEAPAQAHARPESKIA